MDVSVYEGPTRTRTCGGERGGAAASRTRNITDFQRATIFNRTVGNAQPTHLAPDTHGAYFHASPVRPANCAIAVLHGARPAALARERVDDAARPLATAPLSAASPCLPPRRAPAPGTAALKPEVRLGPGGLFALQRLAHLFSARFRVAVRCRPRETRQLDPSLPLASNVDGRCVSTRAHSRKLLAFLPVRDALSQHSQQVSARLPNLIVHRSLSLCVPSRPQPDRRRVAPYAQRSRQHDKHAPGSAARRPRRHGPVVRWIRLSPWPQIAHATALFVDARTAF